MKVVFMGTPEFAVPAFEAIADEDEFEIVGVYTQPDRPVGRGQKLSESAIKVASKRRGLSVFQPKNLKKSRGELEGLSPDVIVVAAYGEILRQEILDLPRFGCINIHSSLLPRWRGAAPIQWAIMSGDEETGVTIMKMVSKLDAGAILAQKSTRIKKTDTASSVHDRLAEMSAPLVIDVLKRIVEGKIEPIEQVETDVTFAPKLEKNMQWLDWTESAVQLWQKVRALNPWPGTSVNLILEDRSERRLKLLDAKVGGKIPGFAAPGTIYSKGGQVFLGTQDGSLEILKMQWEGKSAVDARAFLNGLESSPAGSGEDILFRVQGGDQ